MHSTVIKAVLFDKDGTLIDFSSTFGPATVRVIDELARKYSAPANELADILDFDLALEACRPESVLIAGSLSDIGKALAKPLLHSDIDALASEVDGLYLKFSANSLTPFPFTRDVLAELQTRGLPLGIATNDSEEAAQLHMKQLNLLSFFDLTLGFDSGHGGKPGPGMVEAFATHCEITPQQVAMVGDSETDMAAARAAGAVAIAVTSGEAEAVDLADCADHVLPDISALPALLDKHFKETE